MQINSLVCSFHGPGLLQFLQSRSILYSPHVVSMVQVQCLWSRCCNNGTCVVSMVQLYCLWSRFSCCGPGVVYCGPGVVAVVPMPFLWSRCGLCGSPVIVTCTGFLLDHLLSAGFYLCAKDHCKSELIFLCLCLKLICQMKQFRCDCGLF